MPATAPDPEMAIEIRGLSTRFGDQIIHEGLDLDVRRAEIFALVGGSGSGKSTLLREMIQLHRPDAGSIRVLGVDLHGLGDAETLALRRRCGVMFQQGGLFASLSVQENIGLPLREHTGLDDELIDAIAVSKLAMAGLPPQAAARQPAELSGGMMKRAALARALALDPELLFLDEPTAGLDPQGADGVDDLLLHLRELFDLTIVVITHDLDLLWQVADRVAVLADGKVQATGSMDELSKLDNAAVRPFFDGVRARAAAGQPRPPAAAQVNGEAPSKPR